ncbi:DeoR/GlpR family DNA-binding transcription regulator [Niabella ginsengisoli]|uniref:hypothetical protein n=1 Tax=Niabella ginsengisoli TaxID=522298 RepID=UPI00293EF1C1|nr:hypothetical protein [Niabella ginsengisoli]
MFRTRGGASMHNPYAVERPINEKEFIKSDEKKKIAKVALGMIGQNDSIMIGSGTTVYEVARALYPEKKSLLLRRRLKWHLNFATGLM